MVRRRLGKPWILSGYVAIFHLLVATGYAESRSSGWRNYQVYDPDMRHTTIYSYEGDAEKWMNHCAALEYFQGHWVALWNANLDTLKDGQPGQFTLMSISADDGLTWSDPAPAFSSPASSINPVPLYEGLEWQPGLTVVGDRLLAVWHKHHPRNQEEEAPGVYISTLRGITGKWENRRLFFKENISHPGVSPQFGGSLFPRLHERAWRVFPVGPPLHLSCGRILAPATLSHFRPSGRLPLTNIMTIDTALISDDHGVTWTVSEGTMMPSGEAAQWEPAFFEGDDGQVWMFAKNQPYPKENWRGRFSERLAYACSFDRGETWSLKQTVPLNVANTRMQVLAGSGNRYYMLINDWLPGNGYGNRFNLALFFNRGGGINFVPGIGISERTERHAHYPAAVIRDNALYVAYTSGTQQQMALDKIRMVRISPLPDPETYYIFPRGNSFPEREDSVSWHNEQDGSAILVLQGEASAGLDLDPHDRTRGDGVHIRFRFRILEGSRQVVCTIGGEKDYVELRAEQGRLSLKARNNEGFDFVELGPVLEGWMDVELFTGGNTTGVRIGDADFSYVSHNPGQSWVYLGKGYPRPPIFPLRPHDFEVPEESRVAFRINTLQTKIQKPLLRGN